MPQGSQSNKAKDFLGGDKRKQTKNKKQMIKTSYTVIFVWLASGKAVKYSFQDDNRHDFRALHGVNDPMPADSREVY